MSKKISLNLKNSIIYYILAVIILIFAVLLLKFSKEVSASILVSINSCLIVIIPSLFGFMVVSNILVKSNIYILLSLPFYPISKYLFRIPPELFSIFILSNIGGYPIGTKLLKELLKDNKITKETASKMLCYCYCSGPAFIIGAIGVKIFNNVLIGLLIYLSILLSNFLIAIIVGFKNEIPKKSYIKQPIVLNSSILIESIQDSAKTLSLICSTIVFFSAFITLLEETGLLLKVSNILSIILKTSGNYSKIFSSAFFEVSKISDMPQFSYKFVPIIAGIVSLGGICVLLQISGISGGKVSFKRFIITRPFQIIFSSLISVYLIKVFAKNIVIMTIFAPQIHLENKATILPSVLIIIMTILLLFKNMNTTNSHKTKQKNN